MHGGPLDDDLFPLDGDIHRLGLGVDLLANVDLARLYRPLLRVQPLLLHLKSVALAARRLGRGRVRPGLGAARRGVGGFGLVTPVARVVRPVPPQDGRRLSALPSAFTVTIVRPASNSLS